MVLNGEFFFYIFYYIKNGLNNKLVLYLCIFIVNVWCVKINNEIFVRYNNGGLGFYCVFVFVSYCRKKDFIGWFSFFLVLDIWFGKEDGGCCG